MRETFLLCGRVYALSTYSVLSPYPQCRRLTVSNALIKRCRNCYKTKDSVLMDESCAVYARKLCCTSNRAFRADLPSSIDCHQYCAGSILPSSKCGGRFQPGFCSSTSLCPHKAVVDLLAARLKASTWPAWPACTNRRTVAVGPHCAGIRVGSCPPSPCQSLVRAALWVCQVGVCCVS